jgi:NAD(P)-dependent dehydrogenase (short-subunit alcohol dehydrogenase family)
MQIEGKTAVVTGASQGIGLALTRTLLAQGAAQVVIGDIAPITDPGLLTQEPARLRWQACDVTSSAEVEAFAASAGQVDLVFCNAGVNAMQGLLADDHLIAAKQEIEVNYLGALRVVRALVPRLRRSGDRRAIVFTGSILAEDPISAFATYCISKAALGAMADILRAELTDADVQILLAKPGAVDTNLIGSLDIPKITAGEAAHEILSALQAGESEVLVGPEARARAQTISARRIAFYRNYARQGDIEPHQ